MRNWNSYDSYVQYFLSYRVKNYDDLIKAYLSHDSDITNLIELETLKEDNPNEDQHKERRSTFGKINEEANQEKIDDLQLECWDKIPQIDRPNFSISSIVDIIPRLLYNKKNLCVEKEVNAPQLYSSTSAYLNSCGEYAYIVGLLVYEDLSSVSQADQEMNYFKEQKAEEDRIREKKTLVSLGREGTESTKDATFTTNKLGVQKNNRVTLSSVSEEDQLFSSRGNTITSKAEDMPPGLGDKNIEEEDQKRVLMENLANVSSDDDSESHRDTLNFAKINSEPPDAWALGQDPLEEFKIMNSNFKKSETIAKNKVPNDKIKLPKLLVLVSKYPIYKDMERFLKKIKSYCFDITSVPIERMITNLVYEFPHPGFKYIVKSSFWGSSEKKKFEYETVDSLPFWEPKHFLEMTEYKDNILLVWQILERVLFERSIILVSKKIDKLISWTEILKNLIFPFKFTGLIIPYMCRPDLMLLSSDSKCSYIVGLSPKSYDYWRSYLPSIVTCFDIDRKKISQNRKEFIQATESMIINSNSILEKSKQLEIPASLYLPQIKTLESLVAKHPPKPYKEKHIARYASKIRNYFYNFFLDDMLEVKLWDYSQKEGYLHNEIRKKLPKWHFDFIKNFSKTQTFKKFELKVSKCTTPEAEKLDRLLQNFKNKSKKSKKKKEEDVREEIHIDKNMKKIGYNELRELYHQENHDLPILEQIPSNKEVQKGTCYRYFYIPKFLFELSWTTQVIKDIKWPPVSLLGNLPGSLHDILNPKEFYTYENINDALWLACWIGAYWYHEDAEK